MEQKIKVATIVGTRPEVIKLSQVIKQLDLFTKHSLIHTGQNFDYELNEVFFQDLNIRKPDIFMDAAGKNAAETISNVIIKSDDIFAEQKFDALLVYGDTNSCLSVISAKKRKIPIFHMEAGNRCFDQRVPEEINRKIVDHLSDINMPLTEHARKYLEREGISPETIIKTGSPIKEVLAAQNEKIEESNILVQMGLESKNYFVVSFHREENIEDFENLENILQALKDISIEFKKPIIISSHPRTKKKLQSIGYEDNDKLIRFVKPFGFNDYNKLQKEAYCVVSDSGSVTEEASILGFPAITIRQTHERPEGMDHGVLIMTGINPSRIIESIKVIVSQFESGYRSKIVSDYDINDVSYKVVRIILSYTDYIKRNVWKTGQNL